MSAKSDAYRRDIIEKWGDDLITDDEVLWHLKELIKMVKKEGAAA